MLEETQKTIEKMEQIKNTLVNEYDDFSRDDVQFSYDSEGNIDNEDDQLWYEDRLSREEEYKEAIKNVDDIIQLLTNEEVRLRSKTEFK